MKLNFARLADPIHQALPLILGLTLFAKPGLSAAEAGGALAFDGTNDFAVVPHRAELNTLPFTFSAWFSTSQTNASVTLAAKGVGGSSAGSFRVYLVNGVLFAGYFRDVFSYVTLQAADSSLAVAGWHGVAVAVDTNGGRLFLDGRLRDTQHWHGSPGVPTNTANLLLGIWSTRSTYFRGWLDEVALWQVARSPAEIEASLYQPLTGTEPGLLAAWPMDEASGDALLDATSHHLDGYLTNGLARVRSAMPAAGGALGFSMPGDHLCLADFGAAAPTNEITVEFWLKPTQSEEQTLFTLSPEEPGQRLSLRLMAGGERTRDAARLVWDFGDPLGGGRLTYEPAELPLGVWQHFALVASARDHAMRCYRDGQLVASQPGSSALARRMADLLIGSEAGAFIGCQLDEFRVWNVARTQPEIESNQHRHLRGDEPGLVLYLPFDERAGPTATNFAAAAAVGGLSNRTAWVAAPLLYAPDVLTAPATGVELQEATLHGQVNPNGQPSAAWFAWGATTNYDHVAPLPMDLASTPGPVSAAVTCLTSGVTYHYRLAASNDSGLAFGSDMTFLPSASPTLGAEPPTDVAGYFEEARATLRGAVVPNWAPTWAWFEYGPNVLRGNRTPPTYVGDGTNRATLRAELAGLVTGVTYQYRLVASNCAGRVFGLDQSFTAPGITLLGARTITNLLGTPFTDPGARVTQPIVAVAAGGYHSLALTYDGAVVAWGGGLISTGWPQVGQAQVPADLNDVVALAAGSMHSLALRRNGTVVAWGGHDYFGDLYHVSEVPAGLSNVVAVAGGGTFSLALRREGTVVGWGDAASAPELPLLRTVSAGYLQAAGISNEGNIVYWGMFWEPPPSGLTNLLAVAAGYLQSLALRQEGTVVVWAGPAAPAGLSNVIAIAAGPSASHSLALRQDGTVVSWGGGMGPPPAGLSNVIAIAGGGGSSLALCQGGEVVGWGRSDYGQTNVPPDLAQRARPVAVSGTVNPAVPGSYQLTYRATNAQGVVATATRTVVVPSSPVTLAARVSAGRFLLEFVGFPGSLYEIQCSTNLVDWIELESSVVDDTEWVRFEDAAVGVSPTRFYRVLMSP
jgi:hypothetical protein